MSAYIADLRTSHVERTIKRYTDAFKLFARFLDERHAGAHTVADLSKDMLTAFYDWLERGLHNKKRGLYTKKRIVAKVQSAWRWLFDEEWHEAVPRPRALKMKRKPFSPPDAPTWDEMAACAHACVSDGPRRVATILYYTGLRAEQATGALWEHVDLARGSLFVPPHKGLPGRIIPLSAHFVAELAAWGVREGRVCGWYVGDAMVRRRLNEAWKRAGVRAAAWARAPNQAFRRGVTTGLELLGVPVARAEAYLGRVTDGARRFYLAVGMLPLGDVAEAFPKMAPPVVVPLQAMGGES